MKKVTSILLSIMTMTFFSCEKEAIKSEQKGEFKLELLFEKDGCKIYRFYDGRAVYWSNCEGKTQYSEIHNNGKSSHTVYVESLTNNPSKQ